MCTLKWLFARASTVNLKQCQVFTRAASFEDRRHRVSSFPIRRAQPSCPAVVPRPSRHTCRALSGHALSRRTPCHRVLYRVLRPASHCGAKIVLFTSRITLATTTHHAPLRALQSRLTIAPRSIAPRIVHPGLSPPASCIPGRCIPCSVNAVLHHLLSHYLL